jgi:group I intron endonuclease
MAISWEGICLRKAIYKIENKINGKLYIGQSVDPKRRFRAHKSRAINNEISPLYCAIRKYGIENFELSILEWTEDYNKREIEIIKKENSIVPNGYNLSHGGDSPPVHYGEDHFRSTITDAQVEIIIDELIKNQLTQNEIGDLFDPPIGQHVITAINNGETHRIDGISYPISKESPYHLSDIQVDEIMWLLQNTRYTVKQIAEYYSVNTSTIKHINTGRNHRSELLSYPLRKLRGEKQVQPVETILAKRSRSVIDKQIETGICAN